MANAAWIACILLGLCCGACAQRLIVFGDSISDNGNGTNRVVQKYFAPLLNRTITESYPPYPAYGGGGVWARWSDGPTWPEYLSDTLGWPLLDYAVGSSTVAPELSFKAVGDFWPNNALSNKLGAVVVPLPHLLAQIHAHLTTSPNPATEKDVFVLQMGNNDILGFAESNVLDVLRYADQALNQTLPAAIITEVARGIRQGLEALYKAGGRRFLVWGMVATDSAPVVTLLNGYLNQVTAAVAAANLTTLPPNAFRNYARDVQEATDSAIQASTKAFGQAHPDATVAFFPMAATQRGFVANAAQLGFVDVVNGCTSGMIIANYGTSDLYWLAAPTFTSTGASATMTLSPWLVTNLTTNLNTLQAAIYNVDGLTKAVDARAPQSVRAFLERLIDLLSVYADSHNTLGHITGVILTGSQIGHGGSNPYAAVPSCLLQSAQHMFHDEVHPTTKQHQLLAQAVQDLAGQLFS